MLAYMGKHLAEPDEQQPRAPIWRTKVALSAVLMLVVIVATVFGFRWLITDQPATQDSTFAVDNTDPEPFDDTSEEATDTTDEPSGAVTIIHVAGEVHEPGIVELSGDIRVVDALEAAGGPTDQAQLDALNLAAVANDGDYILVPDRETAQDFNAVDAPAEPGVGGESTGTVDINTADSAALETLPGVGPATAADIIAHREQHGAFTDLADLEAVSGIGPATRERLDGLVEW